MSRLIVILPLGWLLCCAGGATFEVLGCGEALGWPLSPDNFRYLIGDGLRLGAMGGIGVDVVAAFIRPQIRVRFVLAGAGGVSLLIGIWMFCFASASAAC